MSEVLHLDLGTTYRGGQRQLGLLVRGQAEHGLTPTVFTASARLFEDLTREGIAAHRAGVMAGLTDTSLWRGVQRAKVIHAHDSRAHAVLRALAPKHARLFVHRRIDDVPRDRRITRWKYAGGQFLCVSSAVDGVLAAVGVPKDRRRVVYSAVPQAPLRVPSRPSDRGLRLLSLGALVPHKGHSVLLQALKELGTPVQLDIVGAGPEYEALRRQAGPRVRLLGDPGGGLPDFGAYDLLVHPSLTEGLGTAVLDAQAAGLPVLTSEAGGLPEAVAPSCWMVKPGSPALLASALKKIAGLERSELLTRGRQARTWVAPRFSIQRMVQGVSDAYREVSCRDD